MMRKNEKINKETSNTENKAKKYIIKGLII